MNEQAKLNLWGLAMLFASLAITGIAFSMSIPAGAIAVAMWFLGALSVAIGRIAIDLKEAEEKQKRS